MSDVTTTEMTADSDPPAKQTWRDEVLGFGLRTLAEDQAEWSRRTFGEDHERGPVGPLRHLSKEALEAVEAWEVSCQKLTSSTSPEYDEEYEQAATGYTEELADCLLLLLDASRRSGLQPADVIRAAHAKMKVNRTRVYKKTPDGVPSEHVREAEPLSGWWTAVAVAFERVSRTLWKNPSLIYLAVSCLFILGMILYLIFN